jgi:hypothetical protein
MLLVFGWLLARKVSALVASLAAGAGLEVWLLRLLQDGLSIVFVALVLWLTLRRIPAKSGPAGLEPRITAVAGTFALLLLVALPSGEAPVVARLDRQHQPQP